MANRIRVLVVDDSAFMRKVIGDLIAGEPDLELAGTARNGEEALRCLVELKPDVITLDVEMPVLNGLDFLEKMMALRPTPAIMLSCLTREGGEATIAALERDAVDFLAKPSGSISLDLEKVKEELLTKIRVAANARLQRPIRQIAGSPGTVTLKPIRGQPAGPPKVLLLIGASTGGPKALHEIFSEFPANLGAAVLVVQHMPPGFTRTLAERLNNNSLLAVKEAEDGEEIQSDKAYLAPGDYHLTVHWQETDRRQLRVRLTRNPQVNGHRPSVDTMMLSAAREYPGRLVAVLLTGMGRDGAEGIKAVKAKRGFTIAEDQSTCVVFGMPRAAIETGCVDRVVPLPRVASEIVAAVSTVASVGDRGGKDVGCFTVS